MKGIYSFFKMGNKWIFTKKIQFPSCFIGQLRKSATRHFTPFWSGLMALDVHPSTAFLINQRKIVFHLFMIHLIERTDINDKIKISIWEAFQLVRQKGLDPTGQAIMSTAEISIFRKNLNVIFAHCHLKDNFLRRLKLVEYQISK